ncbi:hypothetical protein [Paracoccus sp. (in: a-proteobacteria)]|uniref:hypothetical protein n=1 Tax=Paracoccus sp. TaxID=267 RepID=UPI00396CB220
MNNATVAAQALRTHHPSVAVLDSDVHHGNGTQQICADRADVLTVSVPADPQAFISSIWAMRRNRAVAKDAT